MMNSKRLLLSITLLMLGGNQLVASAENTFATGLNQHGYDKTSAGSALASYGYDRTIIGSFPGRARSTIYSSSHDVPRADEYVHPRSDRKACLKRSCNRNGGN